MENIIYVDILIVINIFINYFLLLSTSKFLHKSIKIIRLIFCSFIASLFSLIILFPPINYILMIFIKIVIAFFIVFISFGFSNRVIYIKTTITFFGINFIFAGSMLALWLFLTPVGMFFNNGTVYFNISPFILAISTIFSYLIIKLLRYILDRNIPRSNIYNVEVCVDGKSILLKGFIDTGNSLVDAFSGLPVCICEFKKIKDIIPYSLYNIFEKFNHNNIDVISNHSWQKKITFVPYNVISNEGMLISFKPDDFFIFSDNKQHRFDLLIGVTNSKISDGEYDLLLNNSLKI